AIERALCPATYRRSWYLAPDFAGARGGLTLAIGRAPPVLVQSDASAPGHLLLISDVALMALLLVGGEPAELLGGVAQLDLDRLPLRLERPLPGDEPAL